MTEKLSIKRSILIALSALMAISSLVALIPTVALSQTSSITIIGDSLMTSQGAGARIQQQFPTAVIDARIGRGWNEGISLLSNPGQGIGDTLVFPLGTNGPIPENGIEQLLASAQNREIILMTNYTSDPSLNYIDANNSLILRAANTNNNVTVADWAAIARANPSLISNDGVHPTAEGYRQLADLIISTINRVSNATTSPPSEGKASDTIFRTPNKRVTTRVGTPLTTAGCWPTTGSITQGPQGTASHERIFQGSGDESVDIGNGTGTPIYATLPGTARVSYCTNCTTGYGNHVTLFPTTPSGSSIIFGHLSAISVRDGQTVSPGDLLGYMGETGYAFGSHLHWEFQGLPLAPPTIPQAITPRTCNSPAECIPSFISSDDATCVAATPQTPQKSYWFVLHRQSGREELYYGIPGNFADSGPPQKTYTVRGGKPGERPTPLPQLYGRDYWILTEKKVANTEETKPHFLTLDIPFDSPQAGPVPYRECGTSGSEQCDWEVPGEFGLHGINGNAEKITGNGSADWHWSSGCIRHYDRDIEELYKLLDPSKNEIRYYIQDN